MGSLFRILGEAPLGTILRLQWGHAVFTAAAVALGLSAPRHPRILIVSNGHGEDAIACSIAAELLQLGADLEAIAVVGEGHAYAKLGIELVAPAKTMPSGGFVYMDWRQFWRDVWGGLGWLTWQQMRAIKQRGQQADIVLAVGDIVVLAMAWLSGAPYAYVGTAKSDYYLRDEHQSHHPFRRWLEHFLPLAPPTPYFPWERWMMSRDRCRAIFPRDSLTAKNLERFQLPVCDFGNPMMDNLAATAPIAAIPANTPAVLVLPGSRVPEAYRNWERLVDVVRHLPQDYACFAAIAPGLDLDVLQKVQQSLSRPIALIRGHFGSCLHRADVAIAMTGTATEQCIGLGKPAVTIPGTGPQFVPAFAASQSTHLGSNVYYVPEGSAAAAAQVQQAIERPCPELWQRNGRQRMGEAGASRRIADRVIAIGKQLRSDRHASSEA
ncbi:MAG: lipid-A-disaccharide synthase-related protein [Cyanobacteria bacterium P01_F01_bin.33]